MTEAKYTDLKKELYDKIKNYSELKTLVKNHLDIKMECIKFNEVLCDKANNVITLSKLKEMTDALRKNNLV